MQRSTRSRTASRRAKAFRIERERVQFKALILGNPNYFGNLPGSGFKPVKVVSQRTSYEQLTCIGLHPQGERLEATVQIRRHSGYGSDACHAGSPEYVRFYVERPDGWHDLGTASFTAHNLPPGSPLPVSYSVGIPMDELRRYCSVENIVRVRGILSWNWEPPANAPGWLPPWGNVLDAKVQIAPRFFPYISIGDLIADKQITIDPSLIQGVDLAQKLQGAEPALRYAQLKQKYAAAPVPVPGHRFGFKDARKLLDRPLAVALKREDGTVARKAKASALAAALTAENLTPIPFGPELAAILEGLFATKGNTSFEKLDCAGYNPETRILSGVVTIKRPSGYSGDLCHAGSTEYVGFWLQVGGTWQHLGTASVQVHDLAAVAAGNPVRYAVYRAANLPEVACADVRGLRLRAILSWEHEPTGPDFSPTWGNVIETHVQPIIASVPGGGPQRVRLMRINGVTVHGISDAPPNRGLANPTGVAQDCDAVYGGPIHDAPFGGPIFIEGDFTQKSDIYFDPVTGDVLAGAHPPAYQVWVEKVGSPATRTQLTNSFGVAVFPATPPPGPPSHTVSQHVVSWGGAQYYRYLEGMSQAVNPRTLAKWQADGLDEGLYRIELIGFQWNGVDYVPLATGSQVKDVYVYNGYPHTELVLVDGVVTAVARKSPALTLGVNPPHVECGDVQVGDTLSGTYSVTDNFFGQFRLRVLPVTVGGVVHPANPVTPAGLVFDPPTVGTHGVGGSWSLDTTGMIPCGYALVLSSWDRALEGVTCNGHYNQIQVGFCLREPD